MSPLIAAGGIQSVLDTVIAIGGPLQIIIAVAAFALLLAALVPALKRWRRLALGTMTGLLLGILLSRVISGFVAEHFGWRTMFLAAAVSIALLGTAMWRKLPSFEPTTQLAYRALLGGRFAAVSSRDVHSLDVSDP